MGRGRVGGRSKRRNYEIHMELVLSMGKEQGPMHFAWENWDGFAKEVVIDLSSQ